MSERDPVIPSAARDLLSRLWDDAISTKDEVSFGGDKSSLDPCSSTLLLVYAFRKIQLDNALRGDNASLFQRFFVDNGVAKS